MLEPSRAYAIGATAVLVAHAISTMAGIGSLWLLTRILTVQDFAGYVVAMSVVVFLGYSAGLGIERTLILRIAGLEPRKSKLAGRTMMLRALLLVGVLSCLVAFTLLPLASHVVHDTTVASTKWIGRLGPIVPATAFSLVLISWYQANHRVGVSELMGGLNDGTRCALFAIAFAASLGPVSVAVSAIAAAFLPALTLFLMAKGKSEGPPSKFSLRDIKDGFSFLLVRLSNIGLQQFDIISIGLLSSSPDTAQYAVASRVASIAAVGQGAFLSTYAPRVRRHLAVGDREAIAREYHSARVIAFLMTLGAALVFFLIGSFALKIFGNFGGGYASLLILASSHVVNASFGQYVTHLSMSQHLKDAVIIQLLTFIIFIIFLLILVPDYGGVGAATSFFIVSTIRSIIGSALLHVYGGPPGFNLLFLVASGLSSGALLVGAWRNDLWELCAGVLCLTAVFVAIGERKVLGAILWKFVRLKSHRPYD